MIAMRSAMVSASSWSWVTMTVVIPSLRCSAQFDLHFLPEASIERAKWLVQQQHGRLTTKARASATRCCWPPDSCAGMRRS